MRSGPQRGMLYFHLLLGLLEARGDIARPSFETPLPVHQTDTHCANASDA